MIARIIESLLYAAATEVLRDHFECAAADAELGLGSDCALSDAWDNGEMPPAVSAAYDYTLRFEERDIRAERIAECA